MGSEVPPSLSTLKLLEAVASLSGHYPVEVASSQEPFPATSNDSTWVNLDSDSSRLGGSSGAGPSAPNMQQKIQELERTVAHSKRS